MRMDKSIPSQSPLVRAWPKEIAGERDVSVSRFAEDAWF
jgi:hypothetical protein